MVIVYGLWLGQLTLETLLFVHLLLNRFFTRHPYFFTYLTVVWVASVVEWIIYHWVPAHYTGVYWVSELLTVLAGFLVIWEIVRQTLLPFPAIRQLTSWSMLALVLIILLVNVAVALMILIANVFPGPSGSGRWTDLVYGLERWLYLLQAALLAAILLAVRRYSLPLGRNVAGLLLGFGLFASLTVTSVASLALAHIDLTRWGHLYAATYLVTLLVWCVTLWEYAPNPLPVRSDNLEQDYARLNAAITAALVQVRTGLRKTVGG